MLCSRTAASRFGTPVALAAPNGWSTAMLCKTTRPTATTVLALLLEPPHGEEHIQGLAASPPAVVVVHNEEPVDKDAEDVGQPGKGLQHGCFNGGERQPTDRRHLPPGQARLEGYNNAAYHELRLSAAPPCLHPFQRKFR
ncbi:hypothetical protein VPH35_113534 [Triticum aestivum]